MAQLAFVDDSAEVQQLAAQLPWGHNVLLIEQVKGLRARLWYVRQTIEHGWSRSILALQIDGLAYERRGKAVHNFHATLPPPQSDLAEQVLKDPYIFDFLTLAEPFRERELELALLDQVQKFLLELGQGFAFVGRQHRFEISLPAPCRRSFSPACPRLSRWKRNSPALPPPSRRRDAKNET